MAGGDQMEGFIASKEMQDRLHTVETQIQGLQGELLAVNNEALAYTQKLKLLEENDKRREEDIRELKDIVRTMQKQSEAVVAKIDLLEMKLFNWMQQIQKDSSTERQSSQREWMRFLQIVLTGTIFAIIAYIFSTSFRG